ncbi:conserved hypothetical protein [Candidatus Desulfarcum epimagneticum]|uniref:TRASH domain-containing protein n=1 Tax=uncultured Desulfobacteraceae bacterium TaxID=218296 RepID=A0A484HF42_9BACT|nr:conserved hypothetical protein [uncultured Desulfobacteraceae bacterium]
MLIRFIILFALFYLGRRLFKSWSASRSRKVQRNGSVGEIDDVMIQDPQCGVYFPKKDGIKWKTGGETLFFCGPECRDRYVESRRGAPK